jgi:prepilin-type N-terminal cleavage/methylation domain-containing protein
MNSPKRNLNGLRHVFTLVEMLVVIAIFSILLMLLQPALHNVLQKATGISCQTNLKQIGAATFTYAGDYNNNIPGRDFEGKNLWKNYTQTITGKFPDTIPPDFPDTLS